MIKFDDMFDMFMSKWLLKYIKDIYLKESCRFKIEFRIIYLCD